MKQATNELRLRWLLSPWICIYGRIVSLRTLPAIWGYFSLHRPVVDQMSFRSGKCRSVRRLNSSGTVTAIWELGHDWSIVSYPPRCLGMRCRPLRHPRRFKTSDLTPTPKTRSACLFVNGVHRH